MQEEFECLRLNSAGKTYQNALWKESATLDFFLAPDFGDSSFYESCDDDFSSCKVDAIRGDSLDLSEIKLLKLEAEGGSWKYCWASVRLYRPSKLLSLTWVNPRLFIGEQFYPCYSISI